MIASSQKYTVENSNETITFNIPFRKLWADVITVGIEILVSLAIIVYAIVNISLPASDTSIPTPLIPFLVLFFVLFVIELLWLLYGMEIFEVSSSHIIIKHRISAIGLSKKFHSSKVNGVFVSQSKIDSQFTWQLTAGFRPADFKKGMVAIYYGKSIFDRKNFFRFGTNLNEIEAQQIVNLIHEKFPQYKYSSVKKMG